MDRGDLGDLIEDFGGNDGTLPVSPYEDESFPKDDSQSLEDGWSWWEESKDEVEDEDCMISLCVSNLTRVVVCGFG